MSSDDRTLLERAAKAAGMKVYATYDGILRNCTGADPAMNLLAMPPWNPLTDDGDSARLRRALRIVVQWFPADVAAMHWTPEGRGRSWAEPYGDDPAAAERRAIVRAAASLAE